MKTNKIGSLLSDLFLNIGEGISFAKPDNKYKYPYKHKSDKVAMKEDWEQVGKALNELIGKNKL